MAQNVRLSFSFFNRGILFYRYVLGPQGEVGGGDVVCPRIRCLTIASVIHLKLKSISN